MKNEEILKKAIEKLGFRSEHTDEYLRIINDINIVKTATEVIFLAKRLDELVFLIIFSHKFAEAFWGDIWSDEEMENEDMYNNIHREQLEPWQHHLQKMVLEENPIKYLEQFL